MWQPIETAPRNQTFLAVLNCAGEQTICTMRWPVAEAKNSRPEVWGRHVERVTHWMPLPDLPGAQPAPSLASGDVSLISEGKTQPAQSVPDDILRDAVRYRFLRAAKNIPISSKAARDPVVYDAAIDAAMLAAAPEAKPCP